MAETKKTPLNRKQRALMHAIYCEEVARRDWMREHAASAIPHDDLPARTHGMFPEAPREGPWWGVQRLGPHGRFCYRAMFRHATREHAELEARFLAERFPGGVFAVMQMVGLTYKDTPELRMVPVTLKAAE